MELEPEQEELFVALRTAIDATPRTDRQDFMYVPTFQGSFIEGNGVKLDALNADLIALDEAGLIRTTNYHSKGNGFNFVLAPGAVRRFDERSNDPPAPASTPALEPSEPEPDGKSVMVVHARNDAARDAMFEFLRRLGLKPLEWRALVNGTDDAAPYVGQILAHAFSIATAVVVVFTPDDEARLRDEFHRTNDKTHETHLTPQARPNVLFEAGMALASHPTQTVIVELGELRPFSDLTGRHTVRLARGQADPLRDIADRLATAGCEVESTQDAYDPDQFPEVSSHVSTSQPTVTVLEQAVTRRVSELDEDGRRWIADRDKKLDADKKRRLSDYASEGLTTSGTAVVGLSRLREQALQEYRDEISRKRRDYAQLLEGAPSGVDVPLYRLGAESIAILAQWREPVLLPGTSEPHPIDDPTDEAREPDLRRFELEGDPSIAAHNPTAD